MTEKTRKEKELDLSTEFVLSEPRAHEFLWWVLEQCAVYNAPSVVNGETGIHIGRRIIGVSIINRINGVRPTGYAQMMIENHNREDRRSRENNEKPADE